MTYVFTLYYDLIQLLKILLIERFVCVVTES